VTNLKRFLAVDELRIKNIVFTVQMLALVGATYSGSAYADPRSNAGKINLEKALACYKGLDASSQLKGEYDPFYPKGWVAVPADEEPVGAYLFNARQSWFFEGLESDGDGTFMDFAGRTPKDFSTDLSKGKVDIGDRARKFLSKFLVHEIERLSLQYQQKVAAQAKGSKKQKKNQGKEMEPQDDLVKSLGDSVKMLGAFNQQPTPLGQMDQVQNPMDPDRVVGRAQNPYDVIHNLDELDKPHPESPDTVPNFMLVRKDGLIVALNACAIDAMDDAVVTSAAKAGLSKISDQQKPVELHRPDKGVKK
jgi:hypothetical protein